MVVVLYTGIFMRKKGKPYNNIVFAFHKLTVVVIFITVFLIYIQHFKIVTFEELGLILFLVSGFVFAASFISGILLSFKKTSSFYLTVFHRIASWLTVLFIPLIWIICH